MKEEIIYTFIDSQNLHKGVRAIGWEIDYFKLYILLTRKYHSEKVFYFIGYSKRNAVLYSKLREIGYSLVFKPTLEIWKNNHREMKGNVDGELILTAMAQYTNYTKAIIISGDGDYYCLLNYLERRSKLAKIIVPDGKRYSSLLRKYCRKIVDINLHRNDISM